MSGIQGKLFRQKWAFVIGFDEYSRPVNKLKTSVQNADKLTTLLKKSKFKFMKHNKDITDLMEQVQEFIRKIEDGDLILFYFSGHGYSFDDKNYLLPMDDSKIETAEDARDSGTYIKNLIERLLKDKPSSMAVMIFDCCRPYVLKKPPKRPSKWLLAWFRCISVDLFLVIYQGNGLNGTDGLDKVFIQYSCAAGETAADNLFTERLLKTITQKNVPVVDVFEGIAEDVYIMRHLTGES